jgi:ATP-binding cassette subfamily A (ABC1) protein 1
MLTGMLQPTSGYAEVAGRDIRTDMSQIRNEVGICLQHNCLFPLLTVEEHVEFFARVRGIFDELPFPEARAHVHTAIEDVALLDKRYTLSKDLSGGMKRKLSVAIAFCGDSKVVFLDEPTRLVFSLLESIHMKVLCCESISYMLSSFLFSQLVAWTHSRADSRGM